ncbi:MAG: ATP-binding protein [Magnetococcales bacterium]|nr:ATP-binding protein [Magnetococcales bacterium]
MLERFLFNQFRNFQKAILPLAPLTLLLGAGASGKSHVVEGVKLLAWMARGQRLDALPAAMHRPGGVARGRVGELFYPQTNRFGLACSGVAGATELQMGLMIEGREEDEARLVYEHLKETGGKTPLALYQAGPGPGGALMVEYHAFGAGAPKPRMAVDEQRTVFTQLGGCARFPEAHAESGQRISEATAHIEHWLTRIVCLKPDPEAARGYAPRQAGALAENGSNLSGVLFQLCGGDSPAEALSDPQRIGRADLLDFVRVLPGLEQAELGFLTTSRGEVRLVIRESGAASARCFDASRLSDGALRLLTLGAAMLSGPEESLLVVDDIDHILYPAIARMVLETMLRIAERRSLRVLCVGRDPALLDALPDRALPHAVLCHRDARSGASRLTRIQDMSDHPGRIAQGPTAHLMTPRLLERFANIVQGGPLKLL